MPIVVDEQSSTLTLVTDHTSYQMQVDMMGYLLHLYWGPRSRGCMDYLLTYADRGTSANPAVAHDRRSYSLDALPQEFPFAGGGDCRSPLLRVRDARGAFGCDLRFAGFEIEEGKYALPGMPAVYAEPGDGAQTLRVRLHDVRLGLEVELLYGVMPHQDVICRATRVTNAGSAGVTIDKLHSACLDFVHGDFDLMSFYGRHAMERQPLREHLDHGLHVIGSRRGTSSHQYNPMLILSDHTTSETAGRCWSMQFVWSGSFRAEAERDQYDQTRLQMGLAEETFSYPLAPGQSVTSPEIIMSFTDRGFERLSHSLHDIIRTRVCRGWWRDRVRPILLNSWEAFYMDFSGDDIVSLARRAAELGIDMLVLDDGWFSRRSTDDRALGDWWVNEEKLGGTLRDLIGRVNDLGVRFGIWMEPEMVSQDSDLFRAHPDWALTIPGKEPVVGRSQLVLDFSRPEVVDALFDQVCRLLDQGNIEYLKWDYNRSIIDVYSPCAKDQGSVTYDYMLGLYDMLERITARYPKLLIEGCAGGGGRFDAGMLYYTPQIWCSDNTDAIDRLRIQYGTSFGYPCSVVGSHVSACPNHMSGRSVPLSTRACVAMAGTFGFELDLAELPAEAHDSIRGQVGDFRRYASLVQRGRYYRLTDPLRDAVTAWELVAPDGSEALVSVVMNRMEVNRGSLYVVPRGLTSGALYRDEETGGIYPADALMCMGVPLPSGLHEYQSHRYHLLRCDTCGG